MTPRSRAVRRAQVGLARTFDVTDSFTIADVEVGCASPTRTAAI
ncbi:MAG: hypothetical protein R2873_04160 [Caldilineaceae bacterium]